MLDINFIRNNPDKVKEGVQKKNVDLKLVDKFLRVDAEWREKTQGLEHLRSEQNTVSRELASEKTESLLSKAALVKNRIANLESECSELTAKRTELLEKLPNLPFDDVPVGPDEAGNIVIREAGKKPDFDFNPLDYLTLGEKLGIVNVKKAAEVAGSRFGYLLKEAALLEFALVDLALKELARESFIPIVPPVMIRPEVFTGMGRLASSQKEERYFLPKDKLYLAGSAEHTIGPFHIDETLDEKDLPKRYVGFSTCFRREAGSYGKDTKGILRVHQFDKVEMFSFSHPDKSEEELQLLLKMQELLMQKLELPYRVVQICTGDMGWTDARQYDIETWFPGESGPKNKKEGDYRETHSSSNTTDFQSRGIGAKYKTKDGKKEYVHMLNATAFAIGRTIAAIIENYQTKKGTVKIPKALQDYVGKKEIGVS